MKMGAEIPRISGVEHRADLPGRTQGPRRACSCAEAGAHSWQKQLLPSNLLSPSGWWLDNPGFLLSLILGRAECWVKTIPHMFVFLLTAAPPKMCTHLIPSIHTPAKVCTDMHTPLTHKCGAASAYEVHTLPHATQQPPQMCTHLHL
jgi:hypothetical protein